MTAAPQLGSFGRAEIERRIPHRGRMCLLDRLEAVSDTVIHCSADNHRDDHHPLRHSGRLLGPTAIEYAAQATALHQALVQEHMGDGDAAAARPGFIASAREVQMHCLRLDEVSGRLQVFAELQHGGDRQALYRFRVEDDTGNRLVEGRLTVVLDTPLAPP